MLPPLKGIGTTPGIYVTQTFGQNPSIYAQFGLNGHNGIDWACPSGTPVYAPLDGDLSFETEPTNYGHGYGMNARLFSGPTDNRIEMCFAHLEKYGTPGPTKKGSIIGWSDNTGFSTGAHLHFGIRLWDKNGIINYRNGYLGWIDPAPFLKKESMVNQAKVVKSKKSPLVYICYPQTKMEVLQDNCETEGIILPETIPDSDTL